MDDETETMITGDGSGEALPELIECYYCLCSYGPEETMHIRMESLYLKAMTKPQGGET